MICTNPYLKFEDLLKSESKIEGSQYLHSPAINSGDGTTCLLLKDPYLGDNCIKNFHLGSYIVGYMVGNLVLRRCVSGAVKRDFRTYI